MCVESTLKIIRWLHDRADRNTEQRHHGKEHFDDTEMSRPERLCCYRPLLGEKCAQVHKVPPQVLWMMWPPFYTPTPAIKRDGHGRFGDICTVPVCVWESLQVQIGEKNLNPWQVD